MSRTGSLSAVWTMIHTLLGQVVTPSPRPTVLSLPDPVEPSSREIMRSNILNSQRFVRLERKDSRSHLYNDNLYQVLSIGITCREPLQKYVDSYYDLWSLENFISRNISRLVVMIIVVVVLEVHKVNEEESSEKCCLDLKMIFNHVDMVPLNKFTPTFTSRSRGKLIPKLSASVNISLPRPVHCLVILPTFKWQLQEVTLLWSSLKSNKKGNLPKYFGKRKL